MGVLLGLTLSHARSFHGTRLYDLKPFYRGACTHGYRSNYFKTSVGSNDHEWVNGWGRL
jgi:hypothetical protein